MILLATVSDSVWLAVIAGVVTVSTLYIQWQMAKTNAKLESIAKTGQDTHKLVNNVHGTALRQTAELSRWKEVELSRTEPADSPVLAAARAAADKAERDWRHHEAKQKTVDALVGQPSHEV